MEPDGYIELEGASAAAILDAANRMWASLAAGNVPEDGIAAGTAMLQACVANLVVVMDSSADLNLCAEMVAATARTHPVRSIFLHPDEALPGGQVRTTVSALCTLASARGTHLCSERIAMAAAPDMLDRLHQAVLGLMVEDLPRIVWWHLRSTGEGTLWRLLAAHADHIIIDTCRLDAGIGGLSALIRRLRDAGGARVSDINWGRITPWREMTAQFFDLRDRRSLLEQIVRVSVSVARPPRGGMPVTGMLYVAWLADRLGWQAAGRPAAADGECVSRVQWTNPSGGKVETRIICTECPAHPHLLTRVEIETGVPCVSRFTLARSCDMRTAVASVRVGDEEPVTKVVSLDPLPPHVLMANELSYPQRDRGYEQALELTAALLGEGAS